jgi:hypothetical protein
MNESPIKSNLNLNESHYESFMLVGLFKTTGNATEGGLVIG